MLVYIFDCCRQAFMGSFIPLVKIPAFYKNVFFHQICEQYINAWNIYLLFRNNFYGYLSKHYIELAKLNDMEFACFNYF